MLEVVQLVFLLIGLILAMNIHPKCNFIWNPIHLDRIRQNSTYQYVPFCTGTYWYVLVHSFNAGTYCYVQVHTWKKTCDYLIHPGSDLRVKFNSLHVLCKRYDMIKSNFKKSNHYVLVLTGTYWYRHAAHTRFISMMIYWLEHLGYRNQYGI
jgi:hypothetical protein